MDWKEALSALAGQVGLGEQEAGLSAELETSQVDKSQAGLSVAAKAAAEIPLAPKGHKQTLCLRYEKRNGKPATIVSGFEGSDEALRELARQLKTTLGVGGSARDDEILLQGDVRAKTADCLRSKGFGLKGDTGAPRK